MTSSGPTDQELIARSRDGDTDAFRQLFERKHRRVYRIAYQVLGDPGQAEEVAQEVFISLWRHCGRYRPRFAVDTWITRIATNRAIDRWRSGRAERASRSWGELLDTPGEQHAGDGEAATFRYRPEPVAGPDDLVAWQQIQAIWDRLAGPLPAQQRAAFVLREIEGLSSSQVAEALGCSASTVRSHISAARKTLRERLEAEYPELLAG